MFGPFKDKTAKPLRTLCGMSGSFAERCSYHSTFWLFASAVASAACGHIGGAKRLIYGSSMRVAPIPKCRATIGRESAHHLRPQICRAQTVLRQAIVVGQHNYFFA